MGCSFDSLFEKIALKLGEKMRNPPKFTGGNKPKSKKISLRALQNNAQIHKLSRFPVRKESQRSIITDQLFHYEFQNLAVSLWYFDKIR